MSGIRRATRREPAYGEQGNRLLALTRAQGFRFFQVVSSGSTYGTWTTNGAATWSGGTLNLLNGSSGNAPTIVHDQVVMPSSYDGLSVSMRAAVSGSADAFSFGIVDHATTTTALAGDFGATGDGGLANYHNTYFRFFSTNFVQVNALNRSSRGSVNTTVTGTNTWTILYSGADRNAMTVTVYKNGVVILTSSALALPATGRLVFAGRSGGFGGTVTLSNVFITMPP